MKNINEYTINKINNKIIGIIDKRIDIGFDMKHIETKTDFIDKSNDGKEYFKTISFNSDMSKTKKGLQLILRTKSLAASQVFDYIERNLKYEDIAIELSPTIIAKYYNTNKSNISKGIKELVELDIIRKTKDYADETSMLLVRHPNIHYSVNFNYLFNGNLHKLKEDIIKSRKRRKINNYEN